MKRDPRWFRTLLDEDMMSLPQSGTPSATIASELRIVWSELLVIESVDDQDNFVALGGDSIAATLCAMRIDMFFGVEIDVSFLLQDDTTFAMLVSEIETHMTSRQ